MAIIEVMGLTKRFDVRTKAPGFMGGLRSLLSPRYDKVEALTNVDFTISEGEAVALIGPNGAGKSTAVKLLTGLLYPTSGDAVVLGMVPWRDRERLSYDIGVVFGHRSQLWYHLPPSDTFDLLSHLYDMDLAEYRRRRWWLVETFGLEPFMNTPVRNLSLGERMRCELAAALLHKPRILFLDEPSIGLDVVGKQVIRDLIGRINREEGTTVLLTSHDTGDIEQICRRALVLNKGRIVYKDDVRNLSQQFLHRKEIELKLGGPLTAVSVPGVEIVDAKEYTAKLLVDTRLAPVQDVVADLLARNHVLDLTINNPSLESTIAAIYSIHGREVETA